MNYHINDFDYDLPPSLIAQFPLVDRTGSRLLVAPENSDTFTHAQFLQLLEFVRPNDLIIFNDTRVLKARLHGQKDSGGKISGLVERVLDDHRVLMHLKSSHAAKTGTRMRFENAFDAVVLSRADDLFELQLLSELSATVLLEKYGHVPLPPYIARSAEKQDASRYQTVYAKTQGAVAAPTAGLHFDESLLSALKNKIDVEFLTLHVGAGTFQPVRVDDIEKHVMHREWITVTSTLCEKIHACRARGGRVIAVGTTVVRALETVAQSGTLQAFSGDTTIFIRPGFQFKIVDALITNFHLPKSTLLMLVCAFVGFDRIMRAYREAIDKHYRFFSYGDAMFLQREKL
ncbi:MAG: tRNA preQ1(34) S-adenosylmethionine ribosyltransferase-isomerase QueA [Gammaproteobacteria bacterium RIFCSPLOWO2_02_FULL_42_14]|nr:MAG: tRNA preQ1(34) S-adenosylmethionine ribosyltransferase-isomerase QueA [Gammaproteobacteria bacterium RIFCSPHIGHO2_02_FULL_42_43]OGT28852.1 MAG: tRNA preQ1(34) S-adenosylmethionine ribosyltransferase-isomerase QueA [Gammaproteobacteria bacterium RIFCSPHIGHO2_01_FULL_42_8]OGT50976.1 MAG: tRNA preQ1(34) S-adenosylmethionine ribosyltransferase-isomerase QueA [Gammaproteobacteria bacterium RIFCSPHIGHO2_12_FULL_41_25]OGT63050.1 MAG: tRNA preQ1(34) S-adenosylmethionine ribosyltransferase-isomer